MNSTVNITKSERSSRNREIIQTQPKQGPNAYISCNISCAIPDDPSVRQWRRQFDIWSCKCKFFFVYRPYTELISKEMNNDD